MLHDLKISLNVCKSWSCPNLGIADTSDYIYPVYRLGYAALECKKCGGLPPLFNEHEFNFWFTRSLIKRTDTTEHRCPHCFASDAIGYGKTQIGNTRLQCRRCRKVFTPVKINPRNALLIDNLLSRLNGGQHDGEASQYRVLEQAAIWCSHRLHQLKDKVSRIATTTHVLSFQGKAADQNLYVVISVDTRSGRIVQITTNYCDWMAGDSLLYHALPSSQLAPSFATGIEKVKQRERQFMRRSQFDEIQYGCADLKRNDKGCMIRPVIALHGHFQRMKRCFPAVTDHYLSHECVLRGAAITAWSAEVSRRETHLWFVTEDSDEPASLLNSFSHSGTWRVGWWENVWQRWSQGECHRMIALLTGQREIVSAADISLSSCETFIRWLTAHPWSKDSHRLSARVISAHLVCLAFIFNQQCA